jgi:NAD(P)-dependent dehydrogenase (short-subunit alcohol dehydrogenase family)
VCRERVDRLRFGDQVDQRFACDEDHSGHGRARYMRVVENWVMSVLDAFRLDGRVAVVTGGNRGLGFAFARALEEAGARVAIAARDGGKNAEAAAALGALAVELDVTDPASVAAMAERVTGELGPIDVLVNNAGACFHRPALEVPEEEWRAVWDVNVDGLWHCSRVVGAQMIERRAGVIVNIGSISAMIVNRPQMQPAYNASKAAVHQLTKSLAAEWAPYGIRVNALAPGYTKTEMAPVDEPRFRRHWIEDAPMERYATPEELGPSLLYLASDASSFVTGSVLVVDGGYTLW